MLRFFLKAKIALIGASLFVASVLASDTTKLTINNSLLLPKVHYKPRIEWGLKTGNKRDLSRLGAVIPIYETEGGLWFSNIYGLWDSSGAVEGNFGLGYRYLIQDEWILGGYGFYDRRKTSYHNRFQQLTLGAEALRENLELRINGYVPIGNKENLIQTQKAVRVINTVPILEQNTRVEKALYGFDVEAGGNLPQFKPLEGYLAYYHFFNSGVKPVSGVRLRGQLQLNRYLSLEGELSHDRLRKTAYFVGFKLQANFAKRKMPGLRTKMTQMAIRDIDIVTDVKSEQKRETITAAQPSEENHTYPEVAEEDEWVLYEPEEALKMLGLGKEAEESEVKTRYRRLMMIYHPDKAREKFEGEVKARYHEIAEAYERYTHYQTEKKAGKEVWVRKKSTYHQPAEGFTQGNSGAKQSEINSSMALIPYESQPVLKSKSPKQSLASKSVEISHFTGSGSKDIFKIILYSPNKITLVPKNSSQNVIKVESFNVAGIPKGLPLSHLQNFADNSFWQVSALSDGSFKVQANVRGLGGVLSHAIYRNFKWDDSISLGKNPMAESMALSHLYIPDGLNNTALTWFSFYGNEDGVRFTLSKGAKVNHIGNEQKTPLQWAALKGHWKIVRILANAGANLEYEDSLGLTPLLWAIEEKQVKSCEALLQCGAKVTHGHGLESYLPITWAAYRGATEVLPLLKAYGANVNTVETASGRLSPGVTPLITAASMGYKDTVEWLLANGADLFAKDNLGRNALEFARGNRKAEVAAFLEREHARLSVLEAVRFGDTEKALTLADSHDIQQKDHLGRSAISWAAVNGQLPVLQKLASKGGHVSESDVSGFTPLIQASGYGHKEVVSWLLDNGADKNQKDRMERDALWWSLYQYQADITKLLLGRGFNPNQVYVNDYHNTPLTFTAAHGGTESLMYLINHGADINYQKPRNYGGLSALMYTASTKNLSGMEVLLWYGANTRLADSKGRTARDWALKENFTAGVQLLDGFAVMQPSLGFLGRSHPFLLTTDRVDDRGNSGLIWLANNGNLTGVNYVLSLGADVNRIGNYGKTALTWATLHGHDSVVKRLAEAGADLEFEDRQNGFTPLIWSIHNNRVKCCETLLSFGASVHHRDGLQGYLPVTWAALYGRLDILPLLKAHGADINVRENSGTLLVKGISPLAAAASLNQYEVVAWLIENGANLSYRDITGRTALDWARDRNHLQSIALLEQAERDLISGNSLSSVQQSLILKQEAVLTKAVETASQETTQLQNQLNSYELLVQEFNRVKRLYDDGIRRLNRTHKDIDEAVFGLMPFSGVSKLRERLKGELDSYRAQLKNLSTQLQSHVSAIETSQESVARIAYELGALTGGNVEAYGGLFQFRAPQESLNLTNSPRPTLGLTPYLIGGITVISLIGAQVYLVPTFAKLGVGLKLGFTLGSGSGALKLSMAVTEKLNATKPLSLPAMHIDRPLGKSGFTELSWSVMKGYEEGVKHYLTQQDPNQRVLLNGYLFPLPTVALIGGHEKIVPPLINSSRGLIKATDTLYERPLISWAVQSPDFKTLPGWLLELGADVNQGDRHGITPLMLSTNHPNHLEALLQSEHLQLNQRDAFQRTAAMYTANNKNLPGMEILLMYGADTALTDSNGKTVRDWAVEKGFSEGVQLLDYHSGILNHLALIDRTFQQIPAQVQQEVIDTQVAGLGRHLLSICLDCTPIIGNLKSLGQLLTGTDLITFEKIDPVIEGLGLALPYLKIAKIKKIVEVKNTKEISEKLWIKGTGKNKTIAELSNGVPYDARMLERLLLERNPGLEITSSTLPKLTKTIAERAGKRDPKTGIPFDRRGFPIFDEVMAAEVRIPWSKTMVDKSDAHMRAATRELRKLLEQNPQLKNKFTEQQLAKIKSGEERINGFTWHHHQERGRMQLVPEEIHGDTWHFGGMSTWFD